MVAEAGNGAEAIKLALNVEIDLAIIDISMPRMTGLQAVAELTRRRPGLRTLILSMHENERYLYEALKAGASGYVLKSVADRDLVEACRAAMRGEAFLYPGAMTPLISDYLRQARDEDGVRQGWNREEVEIADTFLAHADAIRAERIAAGGEGRAPDLLALAREHYERITNFTPLRRRRVGGDRIHGPPRRRVPR